MKLATFPWSPQRGFPGPYGTQLCSAWIILYNTHQLAIVYQLNLEKWRNKHTRAGDPPLTATSCEVIITQCACLLHNCGGSQGSGLPANKWHAWNGSLRSVCVTSTGQCSFFTLPSLQHWTSWTEQPPDERTRRTFTYRTDTAHS